MFTEKEVAEMRAEIRCCRNAERYCRERGATAWTDEAKARWNRCAETNVGHREVREKRLEAAGLKVDA